MSYRRESRDPSDLRTDAIAHAVLLLLQEGGYSDVEALALLYDCPEQILERVWKRLPLESKALLVAQLAVATQLPPELARFLIAQAFSLSGDRPPPGNRRSTPAPPTQG